MVLRPKTTHSKSESLPVSKKALIEAVEVDTFDGKLHVEWDPTAAVTPIGQLPFFIQFLKLGNRFEPWVNDCPLFYNSNNAPSKTDVLGSFLLSVLSGHTRYSHITTLMRAAYTKYSVIFSNSFPSAGYLENIKRPNITATNRISVADFLPRLLMLLTPA